MGRARSRAGKTGRRKGQVPALALRPFRPSDLLFPPRLAAREMPHAQVIKCKIINPLRDTRQALASEGRYGR